MNVAVIVALRDFLVTIQDENRTGIPILPYTVHTKFELQGANYKKNLKIILRCDNNLR